MKEKMTPILRQDGQSKVLAVFRALPDSQMKRSDDAMKDIGTTKRLYRPLARFGVFAAALTILLVGCFGSPKATKEEDEAAKRFEAQAGTSVVYVYRSTLVAAIQMFRLYIDGTLVGDSKNESFFRIVIPPGAHTLKVTNMRNVKLEEMSLATESDRVYFVEMQIGASPISGNPKLVIIGENEAQPRIRKCRLLKIGTTAMDK